MKVIHTWGKLYHFHHRRHNHCSQVQPSNRPTRQLTHYKCDQCLFQFHDKQKQKDTLYGYLGSVVSIFENMELN